MTGSSQVRWRAKDDRGLEQPIAPGKEEISLSDPSQQLTFLFVSLSVVLLPDRAILTSVISVSYKSEEIVMSEKLP